MVLYIFLFGFILSLFVYYRYYFAPKQSIKRYKEILKTLGYKVYQQPFTFLGLSFAKDFQIGKKLYKDVKYVEKTVYPEFDVTLGNVLNQTLIYCLSPDLIKQFCSAEMVSIYPKHQMMVQGTKTALGNGMMFSEGEEWKKKRKLLSKVFNFDLLKENIPKIAQICDECFEVFDDKYKIGENAYKYDLTNFSARIFNGVMMKCFFGSANIKESVNGLKYQQFVIKTISEAAQLTLSPILTFFGKFAWNIGLTKKIRNSKQSINLFRKISEEIVKKRTIQVMSQPKSQKVTDIIQALVYQKMENKEQFQYSDKDLIDEFQTFSFAGTDTTTRFFTMIVYYMGKYPHIQQKLRDHIDSIIKKDQEITYENLKKLTYIDWIQFETTRLFGPANGMFWRKASQDNLLKDIPISKGTIIANVTRGNHYNPKYFKDPTVFRPERWQKQCDNIHPYAFVGFSAGPRNCIGKQLALLSSKIALVKLIKRFKTIEVPQEIGFTFKLIYEAQPFDTIFTK